MATWGGAWSASVERETDIWVVWFPVSHAHAVSVAGRVAQPAGSRARMASTLSATRSTSADGAPVAAFEDTARGLAANRRAEISLDF